MESKGYTQFQLPLALYTEERKYPFQSTLDILSQIRGRGYREALLKLTLQKHIYFCFIDYAKAFDCVVHNKLENSSRDGNTRQPDLPLEKSVCRSGSNS